MARYDHIYIYSYSDIDTVCSSLAKLLGLSFVRHQEINDPLNSIWYEILADGMIVTMHFNPFKEDLDEDDLIFSDYKYVLGVRAFDLTHVPNGWNYQSSDMFLDEVYRKLESSGEYKIMWVEGEDVLVKKYDPTTREQELC